MSTTADDRMYKIGESLLLFFAAFQTLNTVCAFNNEDIGSYRRYFGLHQMPIFFSRIVASIKDFQPCNVDKIHASAQYVPCVVRSECYTGTWSDELMSRDRNDRR